MSDSEWQELQQSWRADGHETRARRHRLGARRAMLLDSIFAAFWIALAIWMSIRSTEKWVLVWAIAVVLLCLLALAYAVWNRRDALWPSSVVPLAFLAQAELRCTRRLQMLRFMVLLGAAEVPISLALFWMFNPASLSLAAGILALFCGGGLLWIRRAWRLAKRELEELVRLRREIEAEP
jgi:hypothetical protein